MLIQWMFSLTGYTSELGTLGLLKEGNININLLNISFNCKNVKYRLRHEAKVKVKPFSWYIICYRM